MLYSLFTDMDRCTPEEVQRLFVLAPEEQQAFALKFKHTFGQFATLKSFLLLKELLVENSLVPPDDPLHFEFNSHGKPSLADHAGIHFNISHCPKAVAVAIDKQPIGVDVERFVTPSESLLHYCMNDDEVLQYQQSEHPEATFASLWTQKEALFKQRGTGITKELRQVLAHSHPDVELTTHIYFQQQFAFTIATATRQEHMTDSPTLR